MDEIIKRHRAMVAERLTQGFSPVHRDAISKAQEGFDDIEKARAVRQDGDIHPNGKWVWSSQAAGGKGDWRVIKKPKDGSPAPAPAKKETKSANAPALSSEALMKTLENMSAEDLIKLQSLIADAVAKKTKSADVTKESGEKMSEAIGSVLAQGIKATKRYNLAPDGSPIDLTKLPDQNIITAVVLVQENVDKLAYEATLGGGKKKQEKIAQELEDQRGKLAELQEEADRRGLKNEPSKKVDDEEHTPQSYGHEVFDREAADKYLKCSAEEVNQFQGEYDAVSVIKMTKQDQRDWNEDYGFDLEPDKYPNEFVWMVEQEGSYYLFDNEEEAMAAATAIADADFDFASGMGFDEVSTDGTHVKTKKQDDKAFRDELKRAIEEGNLNSQTSKNKVESIYKSIRKRFGDKASVKMKYGKPEVYVTFGDLQLNVSYREDKRFGDEVIAQWTLSGYESDTSYIAKARKFKVQDDLLSPDVYLSLLKMRTKDELKGLEAKDSSSRADIDRIKSELKRIESAEEVVLNEFAF